MKQNTLKYNDGQKIWTFKIFKIKMQKGGPNNSTVPQNKLLQQIKTPLQNLKLKKVQLNHGNIHYHLMNGEEFGSFK